MSTPALIDVFENDELLVTLYKHWDGYPSGVGKELAEFLSGFQIVNGLSGEKGKVANGAGCLAAQLVKHLKERPGDVYIYPPRSEAVYADFVYTLRIQEAEVPWVTVKHDRSDIAALFNGDLTDFIRFCGEDA